MEVLEQIYDGTIVDRAVHLFRNPFDNLVGRFHLSQKRQGTSYSNDGDGLMQWCRAFDAHARDDELRSGHIPQKFMDTPCHGEWFRYVHWHNRAHDVTKKYKIPVHVLHYEDYSRDYNRTVEKLFKFLELETEYPCKDFVPGKSYFNFFDDAYRKQAMDMARALSSPSVWKMLKVYFATEE